MPSQLKKASILTIATGVLATSILWAPTMASAAPADNLCDISTGLDASYEEIAELTVSDVTYETSFGSSDFINASGETGMPIPLVVGAEYSVEVVVDAFTDDGDFVENAVVWIDFNGNGVLDDEDAVLDETSDTADWTDPAVDSVNYSYSYTYSGTFTVPTSAVNGVHWARALNYDPDTADSDFPCWDSENTTVSGSAVDFTVEISGATPAPDPVDPSLAATGTNIGVIGAVALGLASLGGLSWIIARRRKS